MATRYVTKLNTLTLASETLASHHAHPTTTTLNSSSRTARRVLAEVGDGRGKNINITTTNEALRSLTMESRRLLQAAQVIQWLAGQKFRHSRPTGRFPSETSWQSTIERRRTGAGAHSLFLTDLLDDVAQYNVDAPTYPPQSPESFVSNLFLTGDTSGAAFEAKLSLLLYGLVDANFLTGPDAALTLRQSFSIPPTTTLSWLLLLFLDDARLLPPAASSTNSSLLQAVNCLPGTNGSVLPYRVIRVFLEWGRQDVALALLRQRDDESSANDVVAAETALRVRLANGLLAEAFIKLKRHLEGVQPGAQRLQHAQRLLEELLKWGATAQGLHAAIIRLPIAPVHEEPALISWLEGSTQSMPQAGLILTLYFLMRGRTPEALLAYAKATRKNGGDGGGDDEVETARLQLEELLRAAARTMPAAQRALVVGTAREAALILPGGSGGASGEESDAAGGGIALSSALPGGLLLETNGGGGGGGGVTPILSVGRTPVEAPLVGGVIAALAVTSGGGGRGRSQSAATGAGAGASKKKLLAGIEAAAAVKGVGSQGRGEKTPLPLLFGQSALPATTSTPTPYVKAGVVSATVGGGSGTPRGGTTTTHQQHQHQLDYLLGLTPTPGGSRVVGSKFRRG